MSANKPNTMAGELISALGEWRQGDQELLGYIARLRLA